MRVTRRGFYRRRLPHLQRDYKPHFVTFCTYQRWILPELARAIVLECCLHDHEVTMTLHACVVMPDHVHLIFTPRVDEELKEICSLARIMDAIKGASAHKINKTLGREGRVWQSESFDRVLRSSESLDAKIAYVLANPVRAGLAGVPAEYPWLWQKGGASAGGGCLMTRTSEGKKHCGASLRPTAEGGCHYADNFDSRGRLSLHVVALW